MATMARSSPPFRADHVGSLLRPAALRRAYREHAEGTISADDFLAAQDACVREVVALQEEIGLESITDGEFRRASYWSHFVDGIDGLGVARAAFEFRDESGERSPFLAPRVEGKLARGASLSGPEFDFLRSATARTPKLTMPSPPTMHFWSPAEASAAAGYADDEAYFADLARLYRQELSDLGARGAAYVQLDEVPLAMLCDAEVRQFARRRGQDPERLVGAYIALINDALDERPTGMTVALHLCRGNFKGRWLSQGSYQYVAERLFNEIDVDAFFLEYDTPRAGDFQPLASVPHDKVVVLGLVSSKTPALESADELGRRIDEASRHLPLECLALSPQCGFASAVSGNPVTLDDEIAKLKLVVDVARQVWR